MWYYLKGNVLFLNLAIFFQLLKGTGSTVNRCYKAQKKQTCSSMHIQHVLTKTISKQKKESVSQFLHVDLK